MSKNLLGDLEINKIYNLDCLEGMKRVPDKSIDMILCDLPYGTTACSWDEVIPFKPLWEQYERIIKSNGAIILTASQPFTTNLITSNMKLFKYCWVWEKSRATGHLHAKNKPLKIHEDIIVFSPGTTVHASQSKNRMTYNPQGLVKVDKQNFRPSGRSNESYITSRPSHKNTVHQEFEGYPKSILKINSEHNVNAYHPTQKPVALFEYLIRTYTNEGEIVLDNCMGGGTTAVAATMSNRKWIGFETESKYVEVANKRLEQIELHNDLSELNK
jgi:site-specific DNA-methyltransferase (adenine-specific)